MSAFETLANKMCCPLDILNIKSEVPLAANGRPKRMPQLSRPAATYIYEQECSGYRV